MLKESKKSRLARYIKRVLQSLVVLLIVTLVFITSVDLMDFNLDGLSTRMSRILQKNIQSDEIKMKEDQNQDQVSKDINGILFIGDKLEYVVDLLGQPTAVEGHGDVIYHYGESKLYIDKESLIGYINKGELDGFLPIGQSENLIFIGSSKNDILNSLGAPQYINPLYSNVWDYNGAKLFFDEDQKVNGYENRDHQIDHVLPKKISDEGHIFIGSSQEEVLRVLGAPSEINSELKHTWNYGNAVLFFDYQGILEGYEDHQGVLKPYMTKVIIDIKSNVDRLFIGSNKEEVLNVLGSPSRIDKSYINQWYYQSAKLIFDNEGLVEGYQNSNGELDRVLVISEKEGNVFIGTSKEEVLKILGAPSIMNPLYPNLWTYKESTIEFDFNNKVVGYKNIQGDLDEVLGFVNYENYQEIKDQVAQEILSNNQFFLGSSKMTILRLLGEPDVIRAIYPNIWHYNNSKIYLDDLGRVIGYLNYYNELSDKLPRKSSEALEAIDNDIDSENISEPNKQDKRFFLALGDKQDKVLALIGAPSSIEPNHPDVWIYGLSKIYFSESASIIKIDDGYGDLPVIK